MQTELSKKIPCENGTHTDLPRLKGDLNGLRRLSNSQIIQLYILIASCQTRRNGVIGEEQYQINNPAKSYIICPQALIIRLQVLIFHPWPYDRFIETQSNLKRKKLHRMNQGSNFLGDSFRNRDNVRGQSNLEEEVDPGILKHDFSSKKEPSIFKSIASVLLDQSNKTS